MFLTSIKKSVLVLIIGMLPSMVFAQSLFVKFEGPAIQGESVDSVHTNEIEAQGYSFNVSQSRNGLRFQSMDISKFVDLASSELLASIIADQIFSQVTISVRNTGSASDNYQIIMQNVKISSINNEAKAEENRTVENISLNYETIVFQYLVPAGKTGSPQRAGYDLSAAKPL